MSQMKGWDKTSEKQLNKVEIGSSRKIIQNNGSKDDPESQENNGENARKFYQRNKEQTEMNNTLEGTNSRITEAEEGINDQEDRIVEITATEQNIEKKMRRNDDSLWELWDSIKYSNIHIIGIPGGGERDREGLRKYLMR